MDMTMRHTAMERSHLKMCAFQFRTSFSVEGADLKLHKVAWGRGEFIIACDALALRNGRSRPCVSECKRAWLSEKRWPSRERFAQILPRHAWRSSRRGCRR